MGENALADRAQVERGSADPVGERRAVEMKALPFVDLRLAIERQMIGIFGDQHVGDQRLRSAGRLSITRAGAGAWTITSSQARQAYLGRRTTSTRNCEGTMSSFLLISSPMQCRLASAARAGLGLDIYSRLDLWQVRRQTTPRLARRLRLASSRIGGDLASASAEASASLCSASSRPSSNWFAGSALGAASKAMAVACP